MKLRRLSIIACGLLSVSIVGHANEALVSANQPMKIIYRIAHQNHKGEIIFDEPQSKDININSTIPIDMNNFDLAGVVILSVNGHQLPNSVTQFNQPNQCAVTTDKTKTTGTLEFTLSGHDITCLSHGGIFG